MRKVLVLDFDGTMTDAEKEGGPYRTGYLEDVSALSGLPLDEVKTLATQFDTEVAQNPHEYGWEFNGQIVAPAVVDPYLRMMPVARKIFDYSQTFLNTDDRTRILDGILYKYNYPKTLNCFREGARAVLESFEGSATYVVTNSHTDPVRSKLKSLGTNDDQSCSLEWLVERVHGSAKKYVIDNAFTEVDESMELKDLPRPILLRRANYYRVLAKILADEKASFEDLVVVGDIFELDLSLPFALGARVGILANDFTPEYEKNFLDGHPRGAVLSRVQEIPAFAFGDAI
ncbi:MAG: hypothetical protein VYA34_02410 [Myxococcota bacterium]|nr:hypothetical protein [Myxococcota bacterium]